MYAKILIFGICLLKLNNKIKMHQTYLFCVFELDGSKSINDHVPKKQGRELGRIKDFAVSYGSNYRYRVIHRHKQKNY